MQRALSNCHTTCIYTTPLCIEAIVTARKNASSLDVFHMPGYCGIWGHLMKRTKENIFTLIALLNEVCQYKCSFIERWQ